MSAAEAGVPGGAVSAVSKVLETGAGMIQVTRFRRFASLCLD